ncbi:MAG: STAS-like domain-containing protein [Myxococcota bacterium]
MGSQNVKETIRDLLRAHGRITNRRVAEATGLTRQGVHHHLRAMVDAGELTLVGAGRGAYYERGPTGGPDEERGGEAPAPALSFLWPTAGLAEDRLWLELEDAVPDLSHLDTEAHRILHYATTELVNNVIDHSESSHVEVRITPHADAIELEVVDWGVGIFDHLRDRLHLPDKRAALQELSKGKTTTAPERHTGEGIFFVSKAVDELEIQSGGVRWIVDNRREDMAVGATDVDDGTRVRVRVARQPKRALREVFDEFTEDCEFAKTRIVVRLFEAGTEFVSRSEAKRLLHGLERFREVVLDFSGVRLVGQGFCDEIFRVWARAHPEVRIVPARMIEPVEFMVRRALRRAERDDR